MILFRYKCESAKDIFKTVPLIRDSLLFFRILFKRAKGNCLWLLENFTLSQDARYHKRPPVNWYDGRRKRALHFQTVYDFRLNLEFFEISRHSSGEGTSLRRKWIREWVIGDLGRIRKKTARIQRMNQAGERRWSEAHFPDLKVERVTSNCWTTIARIWRRTWNWKFADTWCRYCESFYNDNKRDWWFGGFSLSCRNIIWIKKSKWNCHFDGDSIASNIFLFVFLFGRNDNSRDMTLIIVSSLTLDFSINIRSASYERKWRARQKKKVLIFSIIIINVGDERNFFHVFWICSCYLVFVFSFYRANSLRQ